MSGTNLLALRAISDCTICDGTGLIKAKISLPYGSTGHREVLVEGRVLCSCVVTEKIKASNIPLE